MWAQKALGRTPLKCGHSYHSSYAYPGLAEESMDFFHKIKDIFFLFSPITLLTWIVWVYQLSPAWYNVDCSQLMSCFDHYQRQVVYLIDCIVQREISNTKLHKPLLTHSISHSTFSIHCSNRFCILVAFYLLEIIKHMLEMLHTFFHLQY